MRVPKKRRRRISTPWWLLGAFIIALTIAAYLPAIHGGFIWDDDAHLTNNPCIVGPLGLKEIWTSSQAYYYPLVLTSFWLFHKLVGLNPLPYHFLNVLVHAGAAVLLWRVLRQLDVRGAWLGAAIWALHPVMVQSVAWITEFKNTQSCFFYLLSILFFLEADNAETDPKRRWRRHALALLFFAMAITSKTSTVMLPVVLGLCLWWRRGQLRWRDLAALAPFFCVSVAASGWTIWEQRFHSGALGLEWSQTWPQRFAIAGRDLWFYLGKLLWPHPLIFIYPHAKSEIVEAKALLSFVSAIIGLSLLWCKRNGPLRPVFFAAAYFVISLFPVLDFFDVYFFRYAFVSDHFQYLASMGPLALAGAGITIGLDSFGPRKAFLRPLLCTLLLLTLGILTWRQSRQYTDIETLWRTTIARNPACWMAYDNLGNVLLDKGQLEEATALFQKTLAIKPDYAEAQNSIGAVLMQQGRLAEAEAQFRKALQIQPDYAQAQNNLGAVLMQQGRLAEAEAQFRKALQIQPDYAQAQNNLGNLLLQRGQLDDAILHYQKALAAKPDYAEAYIGLGVILGQKGQLDQAIVEFDEALRLRPGYAEAHTYLGNALASQRKFDQALPHYMEALRLNPNSPEPHYVLGYTLLHLGRRDEAVAHFTEALRLNPDYTEAREQLRNLGVLLPH